MFSRLLTLKMKCCRRPTLMTVKVSLTMAPVLINTLPLDTTLLSAGMTWTFLLKSFIILLLQFGSALTTISSSEGRFCLVFMTSFNTVVSLLSKLTGFGTNRK